MKEITEEMQKNIDDCYDNAKTNMFDSIEIEENDNKANQIAKQMSKSIEQVRSEAKAKIDQIKQKRNEAIAKFKEKHGDTIQDIRQKFNPKK